MFGDIYLKAAIVIDSVFKLIKNVYPQTLLEECKYKMKDKEINLFIEDILESSHDNNCAGKKKETNLKKIFSNL